MMHVPAERGDAAVLETMLRAGSIRMREIRTGSRRCIERRWRVVPKAVRVLLAHGAAVNALDGMFSATPLVWAAEGCGHAPPGRRPRRSRARVDRRGLSDDVDAAGESAGPGEHAGGVARAVPCGQRQGAQWS